MPVWAMLAVVLVMGTVIVLSKENIEVVYAARNNIIFEEEKVFPDEYRSSINYGNEREIQRSSVSRDYYYSSIYRPLYSISHAVMNEGGMVSNEHNVFAASEGYWQPTIRDLEKKHPYYATLIRKTFDEDEWNNATCISWWESGWRPEIDGPIWSDGTVGNKDGSLDRGFFQLNNRYARAIRNYELGTDDASRYHDVEYNIERTARIVKSVGDWRHWASREKCGL